MIVNGSALAACLLVGVTAASADVTSGVAAAEAVETRPPADGAFLRCSCSDMPGSQMLFNPAFGDDIFHAHPAGGGMVSYKYMRMSMEGLRSDTSRVGLNQVGFDRGRPFDFMMIPTSMTMDMHMLMLMYGITDRFTVMGMLNYQVNSMEMLMDMGPMMGPPKPDPTMRTEGWGDTELRGIYKISEDFTGSLGLSLPTGDIDQKATMMGETFRAPYDMQLGSGTFDLKPALTYSRLSDDKLWNWGGQAMYTWRTFDNEHDYRLGNNIKLNSWLQRAFGPASMWVRMTFNDTGRISGHDAEIDRLLVDAPTPDADPDNYGGQRFDGALGVSCKVGPGSIGIECGVPLYQNLNGLQLETDWFLTVGAQIMF
jgi:hypothetical protein